MRLAREGGSKVTRTSASQISTFRGCARKWALRYLAKIETPQNTYAALGEYIHARLEEYMTTGKLPGGPGLALELDTPRGLKTYSHGDILDIMLPSLPHLPPPSVGEPEKGFIIDLGDRGELVGYIDLLVAEGRLRVIDYKTTSNMNFALTDETIRTDVQATIYGVAALELYPEFAEVDCAWIYLATNPSRPKSKIARCTFNEISLAAPWAGVLQTIDSCIAVRDSGIEPHEVGTTISECEKYGGCPFRGEACKLSATERLGSMRMQQTLKMKAAGAGQAVNPPEGAAPLQAPVEAKPMSALERLKARKAAEQGGAKEPPPAPPPAPPAVPVMVVEPKEPAAPVQAAEVPSGISTQQPSPDVVVALTAGTETAAGAAVTEQAKRRGRPAKTKTPAVEVGIKEASFACAPADLPRVGWTLFVNCMPVGEGTPVQFFHDIAAQAIERIRVSHGAHYALVEGLFGGNVALFAEAVANLIEDQRFDIVLDLTSKEARDAYQVLVSKAAYIVRGF